MIVKRWQGTLMLEVFSAENAQFRISDSKRWTVTESLYGKTNFRWQLFDERDGAVIATSDPFDMPAFDGQLVEVPVDLQR